jgi:acyl dehydratase
VVGRKARFGRYEVTRDEVLEFARKYDPQPFHLSDEEAAKTYFGKLSASGWQTCAMAMAVLIRQQMARKVQGIGSPGVDELRWLKPVHAGDRLAIYGTILETRVSKSKPELGSMRQMIRVTNQHDVEVMRFVGIILVRRRPAPGA